MNTRELVQKWFDVWTSGDFENIPVTDDFTHISPYGTIKGKSAYLDLVRANQDKFLGHEFIIHDEIYENEKACIWYTAFKGDFQLQVSEWHYVEDGFIQKIVAHYNIEGEISPDRQLKNL